jgi:hypothetical protein
MPNDVDGDEYAMVARVTCIRARIAGDGRPSGVAHPAIRAAKRRRSVVVTRDQALAATLLAGWSVWRASARGRRWHRAAAGVAIVVLAIGAGGAAWFARQNHFEWMFRPNRDPAFVAIAEAAGVDPGEPVIGVTLGNEALAFPITRIGYHHLVNTTIARKPFVATY